MANWFEELVLHVLPAHCYQEFFVSFNIFHRECTKIAVSKGLGIAIILGSVLVKIPQVLKIWNARSSKGINFKSVFLELMAITWNAAYAFINGFPFSAWGEGLFLMLQTLAVAVLVLYYDRKQAGAILFAVGYSALAYLLFGGWAPLTVLYVLQTAVIPMIVTGKLIQATENYRNGGTGQLSAVTAFLLLAGSLARIFTSIQETGDFLLVLTFIVSAAVNSIIFGQIIYYWPTKKSLKTSKSKKANKKTK